MNRIITIVLLFLITTKINGQINYLNPCVDFGKEIESIKVYDEDFNKIIRTELNQDYLLRFIAQPSFDPEYVFQVEKETNTVYKLKAIMFQENLWYSDNRDSIEIDTYEKPINKELAIILDSLFKKATSSAMAKKGWIEGGLDGETYYFYRKSETGISCGECWSPSKESALFELVNICCLLIYDVMKETVDIDNHNLIDRINKLYNKIE